MRLWGCGRACPAKLAGNGHLRAKAFGKISLTFMTLDIYRRTRVLTDSQLLPVVRANLMTGCVTNMDLDSAI